MARGVVSLSRSRDQVAAPAPRMVTTRPSLVEWCYAVVVVMIAIAGCAHEPRRSGLGVSAPNPNGCYVFLYDRSDWQGAGVVLNGPARWPKLEGLQTNQGNWRNRIRSVDVGPAATVTVYTDAAFSGLTRRFAPNSKQPRLDSEVSARIESLELACPQPTNGAAP